MFCHKNSKPLTLLTVSVLILQSISGRAQERNSNAKDQIPVYEREPFDRITLTEANGGGVFDIYPLSGRSIPEQPDPNQSIRVRPFDSPNKQYDLFWRDIAKLELFEQIVLKEANRRIEEKEFDRAFDHITYLWSEYPNLEGLDQAYDELLFRNAAESFRQENWEDALLQLRELQRRQPKRPGLDNALARVNERLIEQLFKQGDFKAARKMLATVTDQVDTAALRSLDEKWSQRLQSLASRQMAKARDNYREGQFREAYRLLQTAVGIWPELTEARELIATILRDYPMIIVGVSHPVAIPDATSMYSWPARRAGRLTERLMMELVGVGSEGGEYVGPLCSLIMSEDGRQFSLQIRQTEATDSRMTYTGYDAARQLLDLADPSDQIYSPLWERIVKGIAVSRVYNVNVELNRRHLRVESLLRIVLARDEHPRGGARDTTSNAILRPYRLVDDEDGTTSFIANESYALRTSTQPQVVWEQQFDNATDAVEALRLGTIDIVDRVYPADVPRIRNHEGIVVKPYAIPTVHMLVPNVTRPYLSSRKFRRALVYGINRPLLLDQEILAGSEVSGCRLVSGPFPPGIGDVDPLGYGYDTSIAPRPYEPEIAMILAEVAMQEQWKAAEKAGRERPANPRLTIAHPADEVPRLACNAIAKQLGTIGIPCNVHELAPGAWRPSGDAWDLLYVEACIAEPVVDAIRMFGERGMVTGSSSYLDQSLYSLADADTWQQSRSALLKLHRRCHEETSILPLWQIVDHIAYRNELAGIGDRPVTLYENVEQWRQRQPTVSETAGVE